MGVTLDPVVFGDDEEEAARLLAEPSWSQSEAGQILDEADTDAALEGLRGFSATPEAEPFRRVQTAGADAPPVRTADDYRRAREQPPQAGEWPFQGQHAQPLDAMPPQRRPDPEQQAQARVEALRALQQPGEWFRGASDREESTPDAPQEAGEMPRVPRVGDAARIPSVTARASDGMPTPGKRSGEQWAAGPRGTLDEGLPGEDDISRTQAEEIPLRILRALGAGFLGAVGRQAPNRPLPSEELRQRRTQGLEQRQRAKAGERERELSADEQMRRQRAIDARQSMGIEAQSERDRLAAEQRAADRAVRERQIGVGERRVEMSAAEQQRQQAERAAMADPASQQSEAARRALMVRLAGVTDPALLAAYREAGLTPETIRGMSAQEIQALDDQIARPATMRDARRRGEGTSGPRTGIGGAPVDMEALVAQYVELGGSEETARAMRPRDLVAALRGEELQRSRPRGAQGGAMTEDGIEILPGVFATVGSVGEVEARGLRDGLTAMRGQYGALQEVEQIARRHGLTGAITPAAAAEMSAPLRELMSMVAELQNTGVINPGEMGAILEALPNPTSLTQLTMDTFRGRLAGFQRSLERRVQARLGARGVAGEQLDAAMEYLRGGAPRVGGAARSGGSTSRTADPGAQVTVRRTSDGVTRRVSRQAADALMRAGGFEEVQGGP